MESRFISWRRGKTLKQVQVGQAPDKHYMSKMHKEGRGARI